jgi:hypothetical protein
LTGDPDAGIGLRNEWKGANLAEAAVNNLPLAATHDGRYAA